MRKREDFKIRFQPLEGHLDCALIKYLRSLEPRPKDTVLKAIRAFWLPLACQEDPATVKHKWKEWHGNRSRF